MNKVVAGVIVLVILIVGAVGVLALVNKDDNNTNQSSTTQSSESTTTPESSTQNPAANNTPTTVTDEVKIEDNSFRPSQITIKKGTKVTWTNKDTVKHDVTPDTESADFKASNLLAKDESYEFTFNTPGTYTYHCSPHPFMKGTVVVTE